ncbi:MAG: sugar phosphate isomerase/epimerase [Saprospiraceae bacterium]|nr:sugar phosphate isomerase/epimerase [Saprospiraceae bacterium]
MLNRRNFILTGVTYSGAMMAGLNAMPRVREDNTSELTYHIFSKHLQFLDYKSMADAAANLGFDGIDLTVRKGGHVAPDEVENQLPLAIEAIESVGLRHDMMATDVNNAEDELNQRVLKTAADLGVKLYRLGYVNFDDEVPIPDRLETLNDQMKRLAVLNKTLGIAGAYQNHSGIRVGSQIWDIYYLLKGITSDKIGCQYDIRHGVVEGGQSWINGLKLIAPQINCIVLKDFVWTRGKFGRWEVKNVPLGEGMVDFLAYFKMLKELKIDVPVTVHYEYDLGGVEHGDRQLSGMKAADIFKAMKKDLDYAKKIWREA